LPIYFSKGYASVSETETRSAFDFVPSFVSIYTVVIPGLTARTSKVTSLFSTLIPLTEAMDGSSLTNLNCFSDVLRAPVWNDAVPVHVSALSFPRIRAALSSVISRLLMRDEAVPIIDTTRTTAMTETRIIHRFFRFPRIRFSSFELIGGKRLLFCDLILIIPKKYLGKK